MKTVLLVAVVLLAIAGAAAAWTALRTRRSTSWQLEEGNDGDVVTVWAVAPGRRALTIGAVPVAAPDSGPRLERLRAEGRERVRTLNARARPALMVEATPADADTERTPPGRPLA